MSKLAFSEKEYQRRYLAIQKKVQKASVDAFLITDDANITYLVGVPATAASGQAQAAVIFPNEDKPYFICRPIDQQGAMLTSYFDSDRLISYPERLVSDADQNGYDFILKFVKDRVGAGKIGMEFEALSLAVYRQAASYFGEKSLHDLSGVVNWIRFICSDEEAVVYRQAAQLTDIGMTTAVQAIKPGIRQCDAAAEILSAMTKGTPDFGGDWPSHPEIPAGERHLCPHLSWTDEVYPEQIQINCELGGWRHRYVSSLARTISVGQPTDGLRRVFEANLEGLETILPKIRTGAVCHDIWHLYNDTIGKHGYHKDSRCGYALGIEWDGFTASFADGDQTVLKENMVMHVMIGLWVDHEQSCVLSETVRVTDQGPEIFSSIPRKILRA
ncbi:MAG: Xaa-Pro peptidase family protein [Pseudomonadota bacterium]